ncbi:MAG: adenylosuccinate lyase [Lachnobacterium sp.]|nr:adenylosuccinate lyase [Lachnobacterium sp.]MCI7086587.1 adenylosuccinate lyase [Lachnobacterium sp.]MDD7713440.1 adenylosuccinate lyase [Lachnobacterium sp.]MDY5461092.1 adenylosuccinate lyase [Agathobacter sp.]
MSTDRYTSPLSERYASKEMQYIFSQDMKFSTWRKLWIALAETEMELGLSENGKPVITQEQIDEMKAHVNDINYDVAKEREKLVRHDVMSHVYAYGQQCPKAAGIIHLGATSCYVGDNTDIIVMNEALKLVHKKLVSVIAELANFAEKYKDQPTLAFTHFQPAQPTTVGKRATLWTQEFLMDLEDLEYVQSTLKLLGSKGTTGTQASFLELFDGDQETIDKIDPMIAEKMGFKSCYPVSGQTYSRKVDTRVLNILAGIAASAHKMSNDIRLLQHLKEVEEPFEKNQIGSSAMAYKRNPMRSERIASLSRYVMVDALNPAITSATQWFERTLDDSANKRLSVPEGFLAIDGILDLCLNVVDGLVVYPKVIYKHFMAEIPFMATENIMMDAVKQGGNRQELHEKIRQLSMEAGKTVKEEGKDNNLVDLIAADPAFGLTKEQIEANLKPELYVGRAPRQVEVFLRDVVRPILDANKEELGVKAEINV